MNKVFNKKGLTTLELIISMSLMLIILSGVLIIQNLSLKTIPTSKAIREETLNYDNVIYQLTKDIKSADNVEISNNSTKMTLSTNIDSDTVYEVEGKILKRNGAEIAKVEAMTFTEVGKTIGTITGGVATGEDAVNPDKIVSIGHGIQVAFMFKGYGMMYLNISLTSRTV